jgi:hypothetical protein
MVQEGQSTSLRPRVGADPVLAVFGPAMLGGEALCVQSSFLDFIRLRRLSLGMMGWAMHLRGVGGT